MPQLTITAPDGKQGTLELTKPLVTIGRAHNNDLVLNHSRVSRLHAVVKTASDGSSFVSDCGSTNGVLVNERRISGDERLASGDHITIGDFDLRFEQVEKSSLQIARTQISTTLDQMLRGHKDTDALKFTAELPGRLVDAGSTLRLKKLERENRLLNVLYDAGRALHSRLSVDDIAAQVLELAFRIEGVERGFMMLFDGNGGVERQTEVRYRRPHSENEDQGAEQQIGFILSRAVLERMREEREPILITDVSADERFAGSESMRVSGLRSAMCAPLLAQDRLAGLLYVDNLRAPSAFTEEELNIFAVVATQAAAAIDNAMAHGRLAKQAVERSALERFLAPEVVEMVAANPSEIRLGGVNQKVSILFADIRGFTTLSEDMAPEVIVELLNEFFTRASEVIFQHGGTLDKYLGDGVMALFGAPISKGDDALNAVRAALAIQKMLAELASDMSPGKWPELRVGVGVNTGIVTAGNIGSPKRIDYTVVGDAVNVASRMCASAKPGQVMISKSTAEEVKGAFRLRRLRPLKVKGRSRALSVYSVAGIEIL